MDVVAAELRAAGKNGCGEWRRLAPGTLTGRFDDGVWLVGVDVGPGTYRTAGPVKVVCTWERLPGRTAPRMPGALLVCLALTQCE